MSTRAAKKKKTNTLDQSQSTSGLSQASERRHEQREWESWSTREQDQKVNDVVRYILCASSKKVPVRRDDIVKTVMPGSRCFNVVLSEANRKLEKDFGLSVQEAKRGSVKVLIVINKLPMESRQTLMNHSEDTQSLYGLLTVILSFLLMRPNQCVSEENLWSLILSPLGVTDDGYMHPQFGDVKDVVKTFVEQSYLETEKKSVGEVSILEYKWGPRAKLEVDKKELLRMMCEIYQEEDFDTWLKQFGNLIKD